MTLLIVSTLLNAGTLDDSIAKTKDALQNKYCYWETEVIMDGYKLIAKNYTSKYIKLTIARHAPENGGEEIWKLWEIDKYWHFKDIGGKKEFTKFRPWEMVAKHVKSYEVIRRSQLQFAEETYEQIPLGERILVDYLPISEKLKKHFDNFIPRADMQLRFIRDAKIKKLFSKNIAMMKKALEKGFERKVDSQHGVVLSVADPANGLFVKDLKISDVPIIELSLPKEKAIDCTFEIQPENKIFVEHVYLWRSKMQAPFSEFRVYDLKSKTLRRVPFKHGECKVASVSKDGAYAYVFAPGKTGFTDIYQINLKSGENRKLVETKASTNPYHPSISSDGRYLAYVEVNPPASLNNAMKNNVVLFDLKTAVKTTIVSNTFTVSKVSWHPEQNSFLYQVEDLKTKTADTYIADIKGTSKFFLKNSRHCLYLDEKNIFYKRDNNFFIADSNGNGSKQINADFSNTKDFYSNTKTSTLLMIKKDPQKGDKVHAWNIGDQSIRLLIDEANMWKEPIQ